MASIPPDKLKIGRALLAGGPLTHEFLERELERSGKQASVLGKALLQSGFPREQDLIVSGQQANGIEAVVRGSAVVIPKRAVPTEWAQARFLPLDVQLS